MGTIISHATNEKIFEVIPQELIEKIEEKGDGPNTKEEKRFKNIKSVIFQQETLEIGLSTFEDALKANKASYSTVHNVDNNFGKSRKWDKPKNKDFNSTHDCRSSRVCNTDWGALGCVELYKLPAINERRDQLRKRGLCFYCGLTFIGDDHKDIKKFKPWKYGERCSDDANRNAAPAKCNGAGCRIGAALCTKHPPKNAKPELLAWLNQNNIHTTSSQFVDICFANTITCTSHN